MIKHPSSSRVDRLATLVGPTVIVLLMIWLAGWTGDDAPTAAAQSVAIIVTSLAYAFAWLGMAMGFGWPLQRALAPTAHNRLAIQIGLGIAAALVIDETLGVLGVLTLGGQVMAWSVIAFGWVLVGIEFSRWWKQSENPFPPPHWLIWTAAPAIAVLLVASTSAPGWLWATEFGGYDALSYHLQLPKEWLGLGRIVPLEHNVYSFLPGYMEASYFHLMILVGDPYEAAYACQVLHACLAILSAILIAKLTAQHVGCGLARWLGGAIFVLALGVPWVIVAGSLAYNETAVTVLFAAGLITFSETRISLWRQAAVIGILSAAACGAKLTSAGFVALPLGLLLLWSASWRRWLAVSLVAGIAGLLVISPYLLRNAIFAGNPLFPIATEVFGTAHWSAEQAASWTSGHQASLGIKERIGELWNELFRFGIGTNPNPGQPWQPQWSILFWLAPIGFVPAVTDRKMRKPALQLAAILFVQLLFWMFFTHLQSRFMLPAVVPATSLIGLGLAATMRRREVRLKSNTLKVVLAAGCLAWASLPVIVYAREGKSAPAAAINRHTVFTGEAYARRLQETSLSPRARQMLIADAPPTLQLNYLLPPDARVLLFGHAKPFYFTGNIVYHTTWDRGPLSRIVREFPDQPQQWMKSLADGGFTHIMINREMLNNWHEKGWLDPAIEPADIYKATENNANRLWSVSETIVLYRL